MSMFLSFSPIAIWVLIMILSCFDVVLAQPQFSLEIFSTLPSDQSSITKNIPGWEHYRSHTVLLSLKESALLALYKQKPETFTTTFPLPDGSRIPITVKRRNPFSADAQRTTSSLQQHQSIKSEQLPVIYAGKVVGDQESIVSLCCTSEEIFGIVTLHGKTYNIGKLHGVTTEAQNIYGISDEAAAPSREQLPQCAVTEQEIMEQSTELLSTLREINNPKNGKHSHSDKRLRVEVAVEVDFATFQQFNNSVERASAYATSLIATVSQIFERDLNVELSISYLNVWTSQDPFTGNNTSAVLNSFKRFWTSNRSSVRRGIAHLLSTRPLGGGIATLNALCSNEQGFAVSGSLRNLSMVIDLPSYSWEVKVVAHEIGHNFGSPHTHSCLWPGGAIDSCASSEEGSCFQTVRGTNGTIMSYCHRVANGSVQMRFHPLTSKLMRANAEKAVCIGNESLPTIYSLSGVLRNDNNQPVSNLRIELRNSEPGGLQRPIANTSTDANGLYRFSNLASGQYTISLPSEYIFSDIITAGRVIVAGQDAINNAIIVPAYTVSFSSNLSTPHFITIVGNRISGSRSQSTSNNRFTLRLAKGSYSIIATEPGYIFSTPIQQVTVNDRNITLPNFSGTPATNRYAVYGKVYEAEGNEGIPNVTITAVSNNLTRTAITDANGAYIINNLPPDNYRVNASSPIYSFSGSWTAPITNNDVSSTDFRANPIPACNAMTTLTASSGNLTDRTDNSPTYKGKTDCSWLIAPSNSAGKRITLTFTAFNTEDCCDILTVYDGANDDAPELATYSGTTMPRSITSSGSRMFITFKTDGSENYAGWRASYSTIEPVSLQVTPAQLTFPQLQSGLATFLPVQFSNPANASGSIRVEVSVQPTNGTQRQVITVDGTFATFTLQPGQTNTLQVRFAPNAAAQFTANIVVIDRDTGRQLAVIPVSGTGLLNIAPLNAPTLLTPANGTNVSMTNRTVNFSWQTVANATSYRFIISTARSTANAADNLWRLDTIVTVNRLTLNLPDRTPLYWRVQARNNSTESPFSTEFVLNIPRDTVQTTPSLITLTNINLQSQQVTWQLDRVTPRDSGFVHGTNLYLHRAKATALRLPSGQTQGQISQIAVWFAYKRPGLTNQTYRIELYSGTAQTGPQRLLAAQDYILAGIASGNTDMVNITLPVIPTLHTFTSPVNVGESFFVGVNFGQYDVAAISDAGIVASNLVGRRVAEDWEMSSDGRWVNMSDSWFPATSPNGWNMWIAAGLLPGTTSVKGIQNTANISHFPNPCTDAASINYTLSTPANVRLELYSALGTRLMTLVEERQGIGNYVVPVDVRHLPSGQYYYRLRVGAEQTVRALQVVR